MNIVAFLQVQLRPTGKGQPNTNYTYIYQLLIYEQHMQFVE